MGSISNVRGGDIVDVNKKGRRFFALVTDKSGRELQIRPLDSRINYFTAKSSEVECAYRRMASTVRKTQPRKEAANDE